ncbi:MAG TPA: hypothetical protein VGQ38_10670 [Gaiellaceae bacterium]|jgi:hypothetical protein|nr:hypothetical protein [Gaiellaceae bacterium]
MNAAAFMIVLIVAMMLMVSSGLSKRRLERRPRRARVQRLRRFLR